MFSAYKVTNSTWGLWSIRNVFPGVPSKSTALLALLDDNHATSSVFLDLLERYRLGDGETECLAFSIETEFGVCSDDRKARKICEIVLGQEKVTGSLGLLREAVHLGLMGPNEAFEIYLKMKAAGGFLPDIDLVFFRVV